MLESGSCSSRLAPIWYVKDEFYHWPGIILLILSSVMLFFNICLAEDKSVHSKIEKEATTYALPPGQVQEYRALIAEARAIKAEATLALKEIENRQAVILGEWKLLTKETDLNSWQIDLVEGKLKKKEVSLER